MIPYGFIMPGMESIVHSRGAELVAFHTRDYEERFAIRKNGLTIELDTYLIRHLVENERLDGLTDYLCSELALLDDDMSNLYALATEAQVARRKAPE